MDMFEEPNDGKASSSVRKRVVLWGVESIVAASAAGAIGLEEAALREPRALHGAARGARSVLAPPTGDSREASLCGATQRSYFDLDSLLGPASRLPYAAPSTSR